MVLDGLDAKQDSRCVGRYVTGSEWMVFSSKWHQKSVVLFFLNLAFERAKTQP